MTKCTSLPNFLQIPGDSKDIPKPIVGFGETLVLLFCPVLLEYLQGWWEGGREESTQFEERNFTALPHFPILNLYHPCPVPDSDGGCHHRLGEVSCPHQLQTLNLPLELLPTRSPAGTLSYPIGVTGTASQGRKERCLLSLICIQLEGKLLPPNEGQSLESLCLA